MAPRKPAIEIDTPPPPPPAAPVEAPAEAAVDVEPAAAPPGEFIGLGVEHCWRGGHEYEVDPETGCIVREV